MTKFNLLKKILPPENKIFYDLFEESSKTCQDTSRLFLEIMLKGLNEDRLINAKKLKHKSNDLTKKTLTELNLTFITPIDREDIQVVTTLLNKITKRIVKAAFNLRVYRLNEHNPNMIKQSETLVRAVDEMNYLVVHLKDVSNVKEIMDNHTNMKEIETHGDEILYLLMDELFSGKYDALTVIKLRDIYRDIENALDSCSNVADAILNIVLKHS